jgi:hypothetical protein
MLRVNNFIGAAIVAAAGAAGVWGGFAVGLVVHQGWIITALGSPFAVFGVALAVTSLRLELVLTQDYAVVRGYFRTVRVPRDSIRQITGYPSIIWVDDHGSSHVMPVNALSVFRSGRASPNPRLLARVEEQWTILRGWAMRANESLPIE